MNPPVYLSTPCVTGFIHKPHWLNLTQTHNLSKANNWRYGQASRCGHGIEHLLMRLEGCGSRGRRRFKVVDDGPDVRQGEGIPRAAGARRPARLPAGLGFHAARRRAAGHPLRRQAEGQVRPLTHRTQARF